jgi:cardiolipin synthase A/B
MAWHWIGILAHLLLQFAFIIRVLLRPHRLPSSRIAWIAIIGALPVIGMLAYVALGEVDPNRKIIDRIRRAMHDLPIPGASGQGLLDVAAHYHLPTEMVPLFRIAQSINGYPAVPGNRGELYPDSEVAMVALAAAIDAARETVHVAFYIWLPDGNGSLIAEALVRAASRGVVCRVMVDDIGGRHIVKSPHWSAMQHAGVRLVRALPVGSVLKNLAHGRFDMRNHRKIVVIDNRIGFCGSQNCADAAFRIKAKYAPWVDVWLRLEGPVVAQNQHLFATDWMGQVDEDLSPLFADPAPAIEGGFVASAVGTSAAVRYAAMPELFATLIAAAQGELMITTPYYVPDEILQGSLCATARRGVAVTMIMPARNDSWIVAGAARSFYRELLDAGVRIFEYPLGLLHAKTMTIDGHITLIGSANMDRRSFDLNFENNVLLYDAAFTATIRARQQSYLDASREVTTEQVDAWPAWRVLANNALATVGPVL